MGVSQYFSVAGPQAGVWTVGRLDWGVGKQVGAIQGRVAAVQTCGPASLFPFRPS